MKKVLIILLLALVVLIGFGAIQAKAAESGEISVTVTVVQNLVMTVSPDTLDLGSETVGATDTTWVSATEGYFTLRNDGNGSQDYEMSASIAGGCSLGSTPGADQYAIGWGQAEGDYTTEPSYMNITGTHATMITGIPAAGYEKFDVQTQMPTSTTYGGVLQTITILITAQPASP